MPCKKVCKQYPNDQYGPCAPDISGKWESYLSFQRITKDPVTNKNKIINGNIKGKLTICQNKLYFNYYEEYNFLGELIKETTIGMLYPIGKCWKGKGVEDIDNSTKTYYITEIKDGKVTKMVMTYTESGYQPGNPIQAPTVFIRNYYRAD